MWRHSPSTFPDWAGAPQRPHPRVSARRRRQLVGWLRFVAKCAACSRAAGGRRQLLLLDRVAEVRDDLLVIAALLEQIEDPDPACVAEVRRLLRDGCESPLYNRAVHSSELRATVHYVRAQLEQATDRAAVASR
jgi:hypothetical protein